MFQGVENTFTTKFICFSVAIYRLSLFTIFYEKKQNWPLDLNIDFLETKDVTLKSQTVVILFFIFTVIIL